ncbi:transcription-repair coupling factor [Candidatus Peregrinibacteria bacterium HGW-Peregrinibacteria-1]|jgi:transcription-repair coupling factor|nr:MAG: transcription-repair coupling factor [Candidatus Peregrinibacteria bacterium HGW-Peregrinibacteria-1]
MKDIISYFSEENLLDARDVFIKSGNVSYSGAGNASSKAMLLSDVFRNDKAGVDNVLWIVNSEEDLFKTERAIKMWSGRDVFTYIKKKSDEVVNYTGNKEFKGVLNRDLAEFVSRFSFHEKAIFIVDFNSILQDFPSAEHLRRNSVKISSSEKDVSIVKLVQNLVARGYVLADDNNNIQKGEYFRTGDLLTVWPINIEEQVKIDFDFDDVSKITVGGKKVGEVNIYPIDFTESANNIFDLLRDSDLVVDDEVDVVDEHYEMWNEYMAIAAERAKKITFSTFNEDVSKHRHMHFLSVLKYRSGYDLSNDLRNKISDNWNVLFFTKNIKTVRTLLVDQQIPFMEGLTADNWKRTSIFLMETEKEDLFPSSFQAPKQKILLLNDSDVSFLREDTKKKKASDGGVFDDFLMSLKFGDYVVHADHGIAKFLGLERKTVDNITKEYLKLGYAENDKLFVPIDQADKVNKYIGSEEMMPKLTRLGSAEWNTITSKVKKETQKIAKELLKLYAERKAAKGFAFSKDTPLQRQFEETFPYEETPGQIKAIEDTKRDMEAEATMDRLVCGDVGFGKTEVAMRAAFKAVQDKKQVALVSPITILADQHYKSFKKRMDDFNVRVEMLSRFRTQKEQKEVLEKTKRGEIDILIGTHRLLQPDVEFKDLGLAIVDEEQRFGVKQKEKMKEMRKEVDILTLTATPIPRTLNISLNKLRDITTITTPPFGRLPVITEVRKYSASLIREAILREKERGGQVYMLHNRVQTIDSFTRQLQELVPEASFGVAHGKLDSGDLEDRIMNFTDGKYDVLVSSTIIENGIDLANANTLIVNNAERFGLAQLYQLRGRVGRGKAQAYAYFLYHGQRLKIDAKKRLRAIVEASDLGSGFQIAMKDLEIRGAGDILGANQHGVISVVGVSHFMRMLNKAVEDHKAGRTNDTDSSEESDVSVELPIQAFIPDTYIVDFKEKINTYQRLSGADTEEYLKEIKKEVLEDYGKMPREVEGLFKVIEIKIRAKKAGITMVRSTIVPMSKDRELVMNMSKNLKPANIISMLEKNGSWQIGATTLRIKQSDLGENWISGLAENLKALGTPKKHGK